MTTFKMSAIILTSGFKKKKHNVCGLFIRTTALWQVLHNSHINLLNAELNPICHLLELLGAHHILHVSSIRVKHISYVTKGVHF